MSKENLKIIYDEAVEIHQQQQAGVDLVYNKLNWILVSDFVFLAAIFSQHQKNILVMALVATSIIASLVGIEQRTFKSTAKLSTMLENVNNEKFLEHLIQKKIEAFNKNKSRVSEIERHLDWSKYCLIFALVLQLVLFIIKF